MTPVKPVLFAGALAVALLAPVAAHATSPATRPAAQTVARAVRPASTSAVREVRIIGHSVKGRAIRAYHLGVPAKAGVPTVVLIATMHGDEKAPRQMLLALVKGRPITGINLWVVPTYNPDGFARDTRRNAHHVDLNRNYPYKWKRLTGHYYSGKHAASEPETRAMMAFLKQVRPQYVVSFHQPLHGVDMGTKKKAFARKVARYLHLPRKHFTCGGACHGTMTEWFNHHFAGEALTAEFGYHPSYHWLRTTEAARLLRLFGGHYAAS